MTGHSIVAPGPDAPGVRWLRRAPAWMGLFTVLAVLLAITSWPRGPTVRDLSGTWQAEIRTSDGRVEHTTLELPGLFAFARVPADARVLATRTVSSGSAPMALLVDRPQYALIVTWDGRTLSQSGDPSRSGPGTRSARSSFTLLPQDEPGTEHVLGLELRGDYGKGGVVGRILVGAVDEVYAASRENEVQRLSFALGTSLLAALPLVVATRGAWRPTYVLFGLFASTIALQTLLSSDLFQELVVDPLVGVRLMRVLVPLVGALGLAYVGWFVHGGLAGPVRVVVFVAGAQSLLALYAPSGLMYPLEIAGELLLVACAGLYAVVVFDGLRQRIPGASLLAAALLPVIFVLASEITLTHGLRPGSSNIVVGGLLFTVALGAALVLRDAEVSEQHERLVRGSLDAMITVDPAGRVHDANPAARRELPTSLFGQVQLLQIVVDADRPLVRGHLTRALQHADRSEFRTTGGRVLESLATPLSPQLLSLTLRDITARRELDRGLLQAARIETVGLLLGGVAHDFNNMLSTLLAHVGLLRVRVTDPWVRDRLDRMELAVDRASELTRRLLTVARGTGSELGPVDLMQVCASASLLVEPTLPAGVRLVSEMPLGLPPVLGAGGDLEQVVVNLLVNARDAVGEKGTIKVTCRPFRLSDRGGRGVALMVEDDGPGVPEARKEEVFQPFVTSKVRGTGLGLAVARQILRDHHGRLWVEDRPGGGSRFLMAVRHADAADEAPAPLPKGRRVLLVEDEQVLLEDYDRALTEAGYHVSSFVSSADAARHLTANDYELLVTDVAMPGLNGFELARLSLELHPTTPILFVSAFIPQESLRALGEGANWNALHKPVRAARLVSTVGRILRRKERQFDGASEITGMNWLFPDLAYLTSTNLGFDDARETFPPSSTRREYA